MRRFGWSLGVLLAVFAVPVPALAHGLGGRSDLPVPLEFFLVGGGVVLAVSFGALAVLWPKPRLQNGPRYRGSGWAVPSWLVRIAASGGVAFLLLVISAGLFGDDLSRTNIAPVSVWVLFWLVLPFGAAVVGNAWSAVNPWAALGRLAGFHRGPEGVGRLGVYPAALFFIAFTWLELVYATPSDPRVLGIAAVVYTAIMLTWMAGVGVDRTTLSADAFSLYHRVISGISPFGRDQQGRLRHRGWLRALPVLPQWPGLPFFVLAMIGTVTYDGLSATPWWDDLSFDLVGTAQRSEWFRTLSLLGTVAIIGLAYLAASWFAARIAAEDGVTPRSVARSFAHTLVPIALAYAVAHYFTLIAFEGQLMIAAISDPFGQGWDLFGTADYRANFTWLSPTLVWWVQVIAIVGGHVMGVVLAHDRALAVFRSERAVRSQYAMLGLMVAFTALGLTILAAG